MTDTQLAETARAHRRLKAQAKGAEEDAALMQKAILSEMARRRKTTVDVDNVRIVRRTKKIRSVALDRLLEAVGRTMFRKVTTTKLVTDNWNAAVKTGQIPEAVVADVEDEWDSNPWIEVSETA